MSTVKVIMPESGFVSWTDESGVRQETMLAPGDEYLADAPIVRSRPDVFTAPPAAAPPPAAPPAKTAPERGKP